VKSSESPYIISLFGEFMERASKRIGKVYKEKKPISNLETKINTF
jgi:hypothetical protein